jgi:putative aminopeptidase FrvX
MTTSKVDMRFLPLFLVISSPALAQLPDATTLAVRFTQMTAVTGFERAALDSVGRLFPDAHRDRAGNVVVDRGHGDATLIVCPFDEVGYVVGGVRDDGWLTLRRVGARAPSALFDQYHEGQRVVVWGRRGALPAVVGVRSTHLTRGRSTNETPFTVDDAFVDIGAASAAEARTAGVAVLDPVARAKTATRYGTDLLAGPSAGRRAACAALAAASVHGLTAAPGRIVVAFAVEQEQGQRGLRTLMNIAGPFARTIIVDGGAGPAGSVIERSDTTVARLLPKLGEVTRLTLPTRNTGTPVETVSMADVEALGARITTVIAGGGK